MKKILFLCASVLLTQLSNAQNAADVISISAPTSVAAGATFTAVITMTNSGANPWTTAGLYNLGSESPRNNQTWGPFRTPLPVDPVNPGDTASFTNTFTAPTTPGVYNFAWGMVQDLVEWFGPIVSQQIKVGNGQFTPGDLVVQQTVATASDPISANGTAIILKNISKSSGATTFEVDLPITGSNAMLSGSSPFS
ncbi:MAG: NBR1-Ig-like domain-containing protein, partial [Limisphaerales bacterium]